jgi:hypothetical protein
MIVWLVLKPNGVAIIDQLLRLYIILETKGEGGEKESPWTCLM